MSESPVDSELRELGKQLPWQRPDDARRDAVRSSLLVAATQPAPQRTRWGLVGGAFVAGALAAAAAFALVVRHPGSAGSAPAAAPELAAHVEAPSTTRFDRDVTRTAQGVDEVVRVHDGALTVAVPAAPAGNRFRVATRDAELEGAGSYRIAVANETIREVTVDSGSAVLRVAGQPPVFLAAGQTWKATVQVAAIDLQPPPAPVADAPAAPNAPTAPTASAVPSASPTSATSATSATNATSTTSTTSTTTATNTPRATNATSTTNATDALTTARSASAVPSTRPASPVIVAGPASPAVVRAPAAPAPSPASHEAVQPRIAAAGSDEITPATTPEPPASSGSASAAAVAPAVDPAAEREKIVEQHFKAGWALLKANKPAEAARELGAAAAAGGDDSLASDARYFQAIALTRAGRKTEAEAALVAFLDHAHSSLRRGRAAVMLARLIAERGDTNAARAWFNSAVSDADPDVVAAARQGLATLR